MLYRVKFVKALENEIVSVIFRNGIEKIYDIKKLYSRFAQFSVFKTDNKLFQNVKVDTGGYGIFWNDNLDLSAEELWDNGVETGNIYELNINDRLAEALVLARENQGVTQKQLSERVGIYQAEISKIERGLSNPSVLTLTRLAEGLDMELKIEFRKKNK